MRSPLHRIALAGLCLLLSAGCRPEYNDFPSPPPGWFETLTANAPTNTTVPTVTTTSSPTTIPSETPSPTDEPTPTETATPDPYRIYTIDDLRSREYGGGEIEMVEIMDENSWFTRYLVRYPSDGILIYGFLDVPVPGGPAGTGPFPVIVALHGYIDPAIYNTLDYTTGYADALARAGYIVFHPNLRGYAPSDSGDNLFRVGMAIDVLNLIALVKDPAVAPDLLQTADRMHIGLWGHSMGGGVATRVLTVSQDVQAAVLYAAMSGDEAKNWSAINGWSDGQRGNEELAVPADELPRISPMYFFDAITARVSIHHGRADELVPLDWSITTCAELAELGIDVSCTYYDGMPHTFYGTGNDAFIANCIVFFDEVLKGP